MKLFSQAYSYEAVELKNEKVTESERKGKERERDEERISVFINCKKSQITLT